MYEQFKIVGHSDNTNSFGLRQFIAISKTGIAFSACANSIYLPERHSLIPIKVQDGVYDFRGHWELPERMPDAPFYIIQEVWPELL